MSDNGPPNDRNMRILQVSASDRMGGAEKVAWALLHGCRTRGHNAWLAAGAKHGPDADVLQIPNDRRRHPWARLWRGASNLLSPLASIRGVKRIQSVLRDSIGQPLRAWNRRSGREDFDFPGTRHLLSLAAQGLDLLHCHNLHSPEGYFDLRQLASLSRRLPVIVTLHDAWLLSGHCAHSLGCDRWITGCGQCPDLAIYPAIARDATAWNWQRKRRIYRQSRLYLSTPSRWLLDKVQRSILRPAIVESNVIPNGVDLSIFTPGDPRHARAALGLPADAKILLFAANGIRNNVFKDWRTLREALARVARQIDTQEVLFIALGEDSPPEKIGNAVVRFVPFEPDEKKVARYYQAADLYVHAAREDTFPITVLEALACGRPVVASAVGGIPEQIEDHHTGRLVPPHDPQALAAAVVELLCDERRSAAMGEAAHSTRHRFDIERQIDSYIDWYRHILEHRRPP